MQDGISSEGRRLQDAITKYHFGDAIRILDAGFDLSQHVAPGYRALDYAAAMGNLEVCAELIQRGAEVNYQIDFETGGEYDFGPSALHRAAERAYPAIVELLLSNGADPNAVTFGGARALHYAVGNNFNFNRWVKSAQLLLQYGADPNAVMDRWTDSRHWTNQRGYSKTHGNIPLFITPLHAALETSEGFQANQGGAPRNEVRGHPCGGANVIKALLDHGADPHFMPAEASKVYLTPFQQALNQAPAEDIELMFSHAPVDLGQRTIAGKTLTQLTTGRPAARALLMSWKTTASLANTVADPLADAQPSRSMRASAPPL